MMLMGIFVKCDALAAAGNYYSAGTFHYTADAQSTNL
jgi:hypothetical protein